MTRLKSGLGGPTDEDEANVAGWRSLIDELQARRRAAAEGGSAQGARTPRRPRQAAGPRARRAPRRSRLAVPRDRRARGFRHVRGRRSRRGADSGYRPDSWPRDDDRRQRSDHQGRRLLSDDGQEAPARAGDRGREPSALRLSGRLRRRQPAASGRGLPGSGAFRPHLLQPGPHVGGRNRPDRGRHGIVHGGRRLCSGDVGRDDHRRKAGHDLPRRAAAGEGGHRRDGQRGRLSAAAICTPASRGWPTRWRETTRTRWRWRGGRSATSTSRPSAPSTGRRPVEPLYPAEDLLAHRAARSAQAGRRPRDHRKARRRIGVRRLQAEIRHDPDRRLRAALGHADRDPRQQRGPVFRQRAQRARISSSFAPSAACRCFSCRTSRASWWGNATKPAASRRTAQSSSPPSPAPTCRRSP